LLENTLFNIGEEKMTRIKTWIQFTLVLALAFFVSACGKPDVFVEEAHFFEAEVRGNSALNEAYFQQGDSNLKYVSSGVSTQPAVIYLHGTPGGWGNGARYLMDLTLQREAHIISLDRPGWGGSILGGGDVVANFKQQNLLLRPLLERLHAENKGQGILLVGHSLGASLAAYLAMQNPELISGLILLAGSLDPQLGKPRWYNLAASMGVVSWFLGADMQKANEEIMLLQDALKNMRSGWSELRIPVTVVQGLRDKLVYPENVDFAEKVLVNADLSVVRLAAAGHFIPWENREVVNREIHLILEKIRH